MTDLQGTMPDPKDRPRVAAQRAATGPTLPSKAEQSRLRKPAPKGLASWWPVAVGVALAFLSPMLRDLLAPYAPWGMRVVFPFVLLTGLHETGFSDELTRTLPQVMLLVQFPIEGLLTKFSLGRSTRLSSAIGHMIFLHAVCVLVLWLVAGAAK